MTVGYVSAKDRDITMSDGTVMNYIQTDTAINSGNSGGPMFNIYGEVIGINSAKLSGNSNGGSASIEGIGFAIPMNDVKDMVKDIMQYGHVTGKPFMGIAVSSVSADAQRYGTPAGAYVEGVVPGSCSEKAGLKQGDIITAIGETKVATHTQLISAKKSYKAEEETVLTVVRGNQTLTLTLKFDEETPERIAAQEEYTKKLEEEQQAALQKQYEEQYGSGGNRQQGGNFFFPFGW
ncbi:MAG: PDZ domain-containing protein, partial [Pseudoflavonifractor sp.]